MAAARVAENWRKKMYAQLLMMLDDMTRYDSNVFLCILTAPWMWKL